MRSDLNKELPDALETAIGDTDLSLQEQFLLEYLYEHDIRTVDERCDRNNLRDQLGFNDDQSERVTESLADADLITIEEFPSKYYYTLAIPTPTPDRHHHYHQLTTHPTPPTNGTAKQTHHPTTNPLTAPPPPKPQHTTPTETTQPSTPSTNTTDDPHETPTGDANPDSETNQQPATQKPTPSTPLDQYTTPPEPALFTTTTIALTGFLHYINILPQELALSTLIFATITYITAFTLTLHNITPNQLLATLTSSHA